MALTWLLERLSGFDSSVDRIHECRHCGETVDGPGESCPCCGRSAIATYEIG